MQNSLFLARLLGPFFLVVGLGVLINRAAVHAVVDEIAHNRALVFFGGVITFPAGLAIVLTHNMWVANWPVLITILGWLAMVTGAVRMLAPQEAIKFGRRFYDQPNAAVFAAGIWIAIGAILCFFGYLN
jgi:hypothetical protein